MKPKLTLIFCLIASSLFAASGDLRINLDTGGNQQVTVIPSTSVGRALLTGTIQLGSITLSGTAPTLALGVGSVGAPSITFGDADTGFYSLSSGQTIVLSTNGVRQWNFYSALVAEQNDCTIFNGYNGRFAFNFRTPYIDGLNDKLNLYGTEGVARVMISGSGATIGTSGTGAGTEFKNIRHGVSGAMVIGSVTVTDAGCTANTRYFFSAHTLGTIAIPGGYYTSTRTAGTSFVITSSQATETSTIDWMGLEP